jgi:CheY-like chemotaxis protein
LLDTGVLPEPRAAEAVPTILIVDDEADVREITAQMLRHAGYDTIEARDGREAWRHVFRPPRRIDAVLADVVMPYLRGTELLAMIMAIGRRFLSHWMSGFSLRSLEARGLEQPPVPLLTKLFSQEELLATVRQLLSPDVPPPAS